MTSSSWLDDERHFGLLPRQALWLLRRGVRQPRAVLLGALALAALLGAVLLLSRRSYEPRIVLRVTEANTDSTSMPDLRRRLAESVRESALTSAPLLAIAKRYRLYPKAADPRAVVEAFRRDVDVEVYQNYFVEPRTEGEKPRSARVAVSYRSEDRDVAIAVTRELGELVIARVQAAGEAQATRVAAAARQVSSELEVALLDRQIAIAQARRRLAVGWDPTDQVALVSLTGSLPALEQRVGLAERRAGLLALGAAYEENGMGLNFELAADASIPKSDQRAMRRLLAASVAFLCCLPLVMISAGAGLFSKGAT